ncbi:Nif3-like dinuclear metal center hexameric protein [[Acholeplasma] multilocale]|uniref:Nif3-like dinuclear metal center hexameric protein n=1 Tax=[Acholeplasma] multilocale TaxID=264638 RepID=UPI000479AA60|nr:Nif3-like dinuclear metal center hexameric protein [[Acholeplasma] multilocale]
MELIKIIKYLDKKFNPKLASEWDMVGLQQTSNKNIDINRDVENIFVCLDLTSEALDEAIKHNAQLIITRHPFVFRELQNERKNPAKNAMLKLIKQNDIVIYSIHTNYDASINQTLIEELSKVISIKKYKKFGLDKESTKITIDKKITLNDFIHKMKEVFKSEFVQYSKNIELKNQIQEFYITTGSGASTMVENKMQDVVFLTGEVKWNEWIYANDNNVDLISVGHYMENYFINDIKNKLENNFKDKLKIRAFDITNAYREI